MKRSFLQCSVIFVAVVLFGSLSLAQLYKGPKTGSVPSGVTVNTNSFPEAPVGVEPPAKAIHNYPEVPPLPTPSNVVPPLGPEGSNYFEGRQESRPMASGGRPVVVQSFPGVPQTNYIPPDNIMAVGPNNVVAAVNSTFRIWDKSGTVLKTILLASWFSTALPGVSPGDPQVIYDHYAHRWVMIAHNAGAQAPPYHTMLSVSDDDDPVGVWYNWALTAHVLGDSATLNFNDYPQLAYDSVALYITTREFNPSYQYCKLRVIEKSQLYANTAGPVVWSDFWDFRDPSSTSVAPDGIRATITYGDPGYEFLVTTSPFSSGTYFILWKLQDPLGSPVITGTTIPVTTFSTPPNANQLGGGSLLIEAGGRAIRHQAIYRDSTLSMVHSVASGAGYSAVHYVRVNPFTNQNLEDYTMGLSGFWHFYPALTVNKDKNVVITYSRSGDTEYIGAYLSGRKNTDPAGLSESVPLHVGENNYVKDFSLGRNRWGDYMGIGLDPVDSSSVWVLTQYSGSPVNTWANIVGKIKMAPLPGQFIGVDRTSATFGPTEVGDRGDTVNVTIINNGQDTLVVSNMTSLDSNFVLINPPTIPLRLGTFESATFGINFVPLVPGNFVDSIVITSNDTVNPAPKIAVTANGFVVTPALRGTMYATTATGAGSRLFSVDTTSGATTAVGPYGSGYTQVVSARVHPTTHEIIGLVPTGTTHTLARINSAGGDAHPISVISQTILKGMDFRGDTLYVGRFTGGLYRVDMTTGAATLVATTSPVINIAGLAFNPLTGQLWASVRSTTSPDAIYKISLPSGTATLVGHTALGQTLDIFFDGNGNLFGITGTGSQTNNLIRIDTSNASATVVGSMGISSVQAIAMFPDSFVVGVRQTGSTLPQRFTLEQNYPNPFNPTTQIKYALPVQSRVTLTVFNILGQEVMRVVDAEQNAGFFEATWSGTNVYGTPVSTGLYFYRLDAQGADGRAFHQVRKMLLLK